MSKLNPNAPPFVPRNAQERPDTGTDIVAEEKRSLFLTFSIGSPLTWQEIFEHFTNIYGPCVEYVYVHSRDANTSSSPQFGRIIFTTPEMPNAILGDEEVVRIYVRGKPVWLKKYVAQSRRTN